jgi:hypothetical protein
MREFPGAGFLTVPLSRAKTHVSEQHAVSIFRVALSLKMEVAFSCGTLVIQLHDYTAQHHKITI